MDDDKYVEEYETQISKSDGWVTLLNPDRLMIIMIKKLENINYELMVLNEKIYK
jgi:hypothetical protein